MLRTCSYRGMGMGKPGETRVYQNSSMGPCRLPRGPEWGWGVWMVGTIHHSQPGGPLCGECHVTGAAQRTGFLTCECGQAEEQSSDFKGRQYSLNLDLSSVRYGTFT